MKALLSIPVISFIFLTIGKELNTTLPIVAFSLNLRIHLSTRRATMRKVFLVKLREYLLFLKFIHVVLQLGQSPLYMFM